MTKRLIVVGLLALVASAAGATAATQNGTFVRCSWHTHAQGYRYQVQGTAVGSVKCSRPFGTGRYSGRYRARVTPPTASETGSSKLSFKAGTVHGSYRISGRFSGSTHYPGVLRISGGTGRFKHATGTLKISCVVHIPTEACQGSGTLKGI
jgi:hypothetical protein